MKALQREIVMAALKRPTGYWAELALTWLEAGLPVDKEIADLLLAASAQRVFSASQASRIRDGDRMGKEKSLVVVSRRLLPYGQCGDSDSLSLRHKVAPKTCF